MNIVADESVDFRIVTALRQDGIEVHAIVESSPLIDDTSVLEIANEKQALLITEDKDFGELTFRMRKKHCGIVLLKLSGLIIEEKIRLTRRIINDSTLPLANNFTVVDKSKIRTKEFK